MYNPVHKLNRYKYFWKIDAVDSVHKLSVFVFVNRTGRLLDDDDDDDVTLNLGDPVWVLFVIVEEDIVAVSLWLLLEDVVVVAASPVDIFDWKLLYLFVIGYKYWCTLVYEE